MKKLEARYPCSVCLGATMEKIRIALPAAPAQPVKPKTPVPTELILDHCARCGGVWFEAGEVQQLRRIEPETLWSLMAHREGVHHMQCHNCAALTPRSATKCEACGWDVQLDCPVCLDPMQHAEHEGIRLDVCRNCRGVWFDHDELAAIWKLEVNTLAAKRRGVVGAAGDGSLVLLDALAYDPFLAYYTMHAAGYAIAGSAELLSHAPSALANAPELLVGTAEVAGEVASSVFETIIEIIMGIFE